MGDKFQSDVVVTNFFNLGELPSSVIWHLLQYLDTDSILALAGTNTTLRSKISAKLNLSVSIPCTQEYSNHLLENPDSHNKPALRIRISRLRPDFIRLDKDIQPDTFYNLGASQQLLLTNLSNLTQVCLQLEETEFPDIANYRVAYLGMLQSIELFKNLSKLHLTLSQPSLLYFKPEHFGTRIVKDALVVKHLVITIVKKHRFEVNDEDIQVYKSYLQNFISSVKSKSLVLDIGYTPYSSKKEVLNLTNNNVGEFKLIAPCLLNSKLTMENLKVLDIATINQKCTLNKFGHRVGRCVLNSSTNIDGCPSLEKFAGVKIRELKELESAGRLPVLKIQPWRTSISCTI